MKIECPNCKQEIAETATQCPRCQTPISNQEMEVLRVEAAMRECESTEEDTAPRDRLQAGVLFALVVFLTMASTVLGLFSADRRGRGDSFSANAGDRIRERGNGWPSHSPHGSAPTDMNGEFEPEEDGRLVTLSQWLARGRAKVDAIENTAPADAGDIAKEIELSDGGNQGQSADNLPESPSVPSAVASETSGEAEPSVEASGPAEEPDIEELLAFELPQRPAEEIVPNDQSQRLGGVVDRLLTWEYGNTDGEEAFRVADRMEGLLFRLERIFKEDADAIGDAACDVSQRLRAIGVRKRVVVILEDWATRDDSVQLQSSESAERSTANTVEPSHFQGKSSSAPTDPITNETATATAATKTIRQGADVRPSIEEESRRYFSRYARL